MDFSFTEEQEMLREQAREYLARYDVDRIAELADGEPGWDPASWRELAELGWTGISAAEDQGGAGLGFLEEAVVFEELGRALYPGPFFSTVALTLPALESQPELVREVTAGETTWTLAVLADGDSGLAPDLAIVDRVAVANESGIWALEGGLRETLPTVDATRRLGRVTLDGGDLTLLVGEAEAPDVLAQVRLRAHAALALEAVGIAQRVLELGIEHASTREQFGKKIGVYQAVSHPLSDTYVETELARSLAYWAAWSLANGDDQAAVAVASASAYAADAAVAACERSIQVHGGIGFTWEHVLHRYYKRALWIHAWQDTPSRLRGEVGRALIDGSSVHA